MNNCARTRRWAWAKSVLAGVAIGACCIAAAPADDATGILDPLKDGFQGQTAPSEKRDQNFNVPGVVEKMLVKEGDIVKKGDLLAQQDIAADEAHLATLKLEADSTLEIEAEKAQLDADKIELSRDEELIKKHAIAPVDYEKAKVTVTVDEKKLAKAYEDKKKAAFEVKEQEAKIAEKKLFAKIDGTISQITTHEGELANTDTQHATITIVKNDPLYVEVNLPTEIVSRLQGDLSKVGFQVQYMEERGSGKWRPAKVHFIKPEGEAAANTEHVQLEMPNPEHRASGLQVLVKLPDNIAAVNPAPANAHQ